MLSHQALCVRMQANPEFSFVSLPSRENIKQDEIPRGLDSSHIDEVFYIQVRYLDLWTILY